MPTNKFSQGQQERERQTANLLTALKYIVFNSDTEQVFIVCRIPLVGRMYVRTDSRIIMTPNLIARLMTKRYFYRSAMIS